MISDLARIDYVEGEKNSFTLFVSNDIKVERRNASKHDDLKNLNKRTFEMKYHEDLVMNGLGFVKVVNPATIDLYLQQNVEVFVRKSLI